MEIRIVPLASKRPIKTYVQNINSNFQKQGFILSRAIILIKPFYHILKGTWNVESGVWKLDLGY